MDMCSEWYYLADHQTVIRLNMAKNNTNCMKTYDISLRLKKSSCIFVNIFRNKGSNTVYITNWSRS